METPKNASTTLKIKFLLFLPTHHKDFVYELHPEQASTGSILLKHYPLEEKEAEILQSVYTLFKISNKHGGSL